MTRDYQIFISFKNSDDITGEDTLDKKIGYKVYQYLSSRGLNVFFSPETLKNLGIDSWSEEIDLALKQSKVFIAIGTQKEYMNSHHVYSERNSFFALKLVDDSRAIYGYIASPMKLKDLPDDMKKIEVFQNAKSDALKTLYTYIRNHLARVKKESIKKETKNNKNYLFIGFLIMVGILVFTSNNNDDLVEIIKEERHEDKKIIETKKKENEENKKVIKQQEEENKRDKKTIAFLLEELKDYPNYDEVLKRSKQLQEEKGEKAVINYLRNIDLDSYEKKKKTINLNLENNTTIFSLNESQVVEKVENNKKISLDERIIEGFDSFDLSFEIIDGTNIYIEKSKRSEHVEFLVFIGKDLLSLDLPTFIKIVRRRFRGEFRLPISIKRLCSIAKSLKIKEENSKIAIWNRDKSHILINKLTFNVESLTDRKIEQEIEIWLIDRRTNRLEIKRKFTLSIESDSDYIDVSNYFEDLRISSGEKRIVINVKNDAILSLITPSVDNVFILNSFD